MRVFTTAKLAPAEIAAELAQPLRLQREQERENIRQMVEAVRARGDEAVLEYTRRFDCPGLTVSRLRVTRRELSRARGAAPARFLRALEKATANIRRFHEEQRPSDWFDFRQPGMALGSRYTPIGRVGIHVPGYTATYPSCLLMSVIPAQAAGVEEIAIATPAGREGGVPAATLAAADFLGLSEVYKMGGPQAIAAFAFGTKRVRKVDKVVGPGGFRTMLAKQLVYGEVGVDGLYGPSEVVIIADGSGRPAYAAADLLAQAEHGPGSLAVLITAEKALLGKVERELGRQLERLGRRSAAREALRERGALVQVKGLEEAVELANLIAPEHLELHTAEPLLLLPAIKHAGCILLGEESPAALGDYVAGPSHVLPTGGAARFSSGLGVADFVKRSSVILASGRALREAAGAVRAVSSVEGLDGHYRSVALRLGRE
jgi:histidinol dehydrogenase